MPDYSAGGPSEFEWPPPDDVLERQVLRIGDSIEPPVTDASAAASASPAAAPVSRSRALQETPRPLLKPSSKAPRARAGSVAVLTLLVIALLQSAYILRTWWDQQLPPVAAKEAPPAAPLEPPASANGRSKSPPAVERAKDSTQNSKTRIDKAADRQAAAPAATTRLMIRSDPSGARVSIDGRDRGVTPVAVNGLAPGEHQVVLQRDGVEVRESIRLGDGGTVSLLAPMRPSTPATGWIAVESPIELDVYEEGALLGTSRSSRILLQAGQHTLQLVNQELAFRDIRQMEVTPGDVVRIPVALPTSEVLINATPWAEVWIDGEHIGQTPIGRLTLPIGTHDVVFRHPQLGEKKATAVVKVGAATRVTVTMRQ